MAKTTKRIDQTKRVIQAAMAIAAEKGWPAVSIEAVARRLKLAPSSLQKDFPDPQSILLALICETDVRVEKSFDPDDAEEIHDKLFDILMLRLDSLEDYRDGLAALLKYMPSDPCLTQALARNLCNSMEKALLLTGKRRSFLTEKIRALGLLAVYLSALKAWTEDQSADYSKTMAILDKRLRQAGTAAKFLKL